MVKIKNGFDTPIQVVKISVTEIKTLQPGEVADITVDPAKDVLDIVPVEDDT